MKTSFAFSSALVLCAFTTVSLQAATSYTLQPGGFSPALSSTYPVGGTVLGSLTTPFNSLTLDGTLRSTVIQGDASNPYGGLTFTYLVMMDQLSPDAASRLTVSSFAGFSTDVSYNPTGPQVPNVNPTTFGRSVDGAVLRFSFDSPNIAAGEASALIIVQTDAHFFGDGLAAVIDGSSANTMSLVPMVPEPGTCGLLLLGLGTFAVARRRAR